MISWGWVDERRFGGKGVSGLEGDLWRGTVGTIWLEPICSGLVCLSSPMWEGCFTMSNINIILSDIIDTSWVEPISSGLVCL